MRIAGGHVPSPRVLSGSLNSLTPSGLFPWRLLFTGHRDKMFNKMAATCSQPHAGLTSLPGLSHRTITILTGESFIVSVLQT